jgi:hypothetical protein
MRFCLHCKNEIPREVMIRARWKAMFCSAECRVNDKQAIRDEKRRYREEIGVCVTCGRKNRSAREQLAGTASLSAAVGQ